MPNNSTTAHLWNDNLKSTMCGLPREIVVPVHERHGGVICLCEACHHISVGHVKYDPTPAEAALIEAVLGA